MEEHAAGVRALQRARASSNPNSPVVDVEEALCEEVIDLGFGGCKLQVQVPVKGQYILPKDLIGKNVGTSFVRLTEEYFARLEKEHDSAAEEGKKRLRTKIVELSGSVEAACALGVADGIVDLVG